MTRLTVPDGFQDTGTVGCSLYSLPQCLRSCFLPTYTLQNKPGRRKTALGGGRGKKLGNEQKEDPMVWAGGTQAGTELPTDAIEEALVRPLQIERLPAPLSLSSSLVCGSLLTLMLKDVLLSFLLLLPFCSYPAAN